MTREEIANLAVEAGLPAFIYPELIAEADWKNIEAFAKLVAAKERKEICGTVQQIVPITSWAHELLDAIRARGEA